MYKFIRHVDCSVIKIPDKWKIIKGPNSDYQTSDYVGPDLFRLKFDFARFIKIPPGGFIPRHSDNGGRKEGINVYHAVIRTNDICLNLSYITPIQEIHLPVNTLWIFDTLPEHASYNDGKTDRIHLVIDSYD